MLKVKKSTVLVIAGIVWLAAGVNILRIGVESFGTVMQQGSMGRLLLLALAALVVLIGFCFMFRKIVGKHSSRIMGYKEDRKPVWYFFDVKGYLLMVFMMGLGIGLRSGQFLPVDFFAAFYTGLGSALSFSGIRFLAAWKKYRV